MIVMVFWVGVWMASALSAITMKTMFESASDHENVIKSTIGNVYINLG